VNALIAQLYNELYSRFEVARDWVRTHPVLGEVYELVDGSVGDYVRDHGLIYAAAVAFYALLSLIPLVILFASLGGYILHAVAGAEGDIDVLLEEIMTQIQVAIPYMDPSFKHDVRRIVENRRGLGLVGLSAVLVAASQVFRALEFSFARIFARSSHDAVEVNPQPRNLVLSKLLFGAFVTATIGIFLVFRFVLGALREWAEELPASIGKYFTDSLATDSLLTRTLSALIIVLGFTAVLRFFGGRRVKVRFAVLGGFLFSAMFIVAEWGFDFYLERWGDFGALYGSFAAIIVVVVWIFFISTLVLMCGQLVKTVQRRILHGPKWEKRWAGRTVRKARKSDHPARDQVSAETPSPP
jgi:YihY family inner membrane protein